MKTESLEGRKFKEVEIRKSWNIKKIVTNFKLKNLIFEEVKCCKVKKVCKVEDYGSCGSWRIWKS